MAESKSSSKTSAKSAPAKRTKSAATTTEVKLKAAATAKVPAKAKSAAKLADAPKTPAKTRTKKPAAEVRKSVVVPDQQRRHYVEMAAYYIAERRGFVPGNPLEDWVQAEAEIDRLLAEGRLGG